MSQEIMMGLKRKYGKTNIRKILMCYSSNIPEKHWLDNKKSKRMESHILKLMNKKNLCIISPNIFESNEYAFKLTRNFIGSKNVAYRYDYNVLMSKAINPFGKMNFDSLQSEIVELDLLVITGIKFGDVFDKHEEVFMNVLTMVLENVRHKSILLSIEEPEINEDSVKTKILESAYGEFGKLLNSSEVEKFYLENKNE